MNLMEAQEAGFDQGIFMHADGTVCEGPNLNFAIIKDGIVRMSRFQECLAGCTMQRLLDLVPEYAAQGLLEGVVGSEECARASSTQRCCRRSALHPQRCGVRARADRGAACMCAVRHACAGCERGATVVRHACRARSR